MASGSKFVIYAALAGNFAIATTKFIAAAIAGSSSMLTEGIHSLVDTGNEALMLFGEHRAEKPPDELHPLGHGRELYFWSFVVALLIFTAGAGVSIYEGILHIRNPEPISRPLINYAVLAIAFLFESASLYFAYRAFDQAKKPGEGYWESFRNSKDPAVFVVLMEDSAALTGIVIAAVAICLAVVTGNPIYDGLGSIAIGLLLGTVAVILARETKRLLIGERADPELIEHLRSVAERTSGVCAVNEVIAVQMAPDQVIATISLDFDHDMDVAQVENAANAIEEAVNEQFSSVRRLFIRPQSRNSSEAEKRALQQKPADD